MDQPLSVCANHAKSGDAKVMRTRALRTWTCLFFGIVFGIFITRMVPWFFSRHPLRDQSGFSQQKKPESPNFSTYYSQANAERKRNIRLFCYINTYPPNYRKKAQHTNNVWARKCTKHVYTSTETDPLIPVMKLNLTEPETREHLWSKMRSILRRVYQYVDDYDFFLKADDDSYVISENLLVVLDQYSPLDPFIMGFWYPSNTQGGYFSGGAGYVLSKMALKKVVEEAIDKNKYCPQFDEDKEDVKISTCGQAVGVKIYRHFDENSKEVFNWLSPQQLLGMYMWNIPRWLPPRMNAEYPFVDKSMCPVSDFAATFHYVKPAMQYIMEFILYYLRPAGILENISC